MVSPEQFREKGRALTDLAIVASAWFTDAPSGCLGLATRPWARCLSAGRPPASDGTRGWSAAVSDRVIGDIQDLRYSKRDRRQLFLALSLIHDRRDLGTTGQQIDHIIPQSLQQLVDYFRDSDLPVDRLIGLFSMVQAGKRLHQEVMAALRHSQTPVFLAATIPSSAEIERMGLVRAPVAASLAAASVSKAYASVALELCDRLGL